MGIGYLAFMAQEEPGASKDSLQLLLVNFLVHVYSAVYETSLVIY
jgi:hypothetical protein